ncbi:mitochondrial fission ELM1 family protein [Succiniclasticum ruminis]|uniref:Fission protein ELM1 n=1 Tax=Succiniclasticum ruminis DSM 9236 TaxID=1123323 RepID=A0A1I2A8K7_9FIRM|nr:ELM1/GtrOC1 family putative glycosyltransferase [Succiniclasticum ruminis]SFE40077.1 hypothetical protein SAMN05216245_10587 [Succiniclasticum ruminis DSM 9236]
MNKLKAGPKRVVLLVDNTRGHFHQSQGIARWLERLCGAEIHEIRVPILTGVKRFLVLKMQGRSLDSASPEEAREWLKKAGFSIEDHADILSGGPGTLFMATGNSASSFCLALAKALKGFSAVIMTPDVVGTQPFDFAIVPEHDRPAPSHNILGTLGAPNHIYFPELQETAETFFSQEKPFPDKVVALLLGGSDANYELTPAWVRSVLPSLCKAAEQQGAALLITTSPRTGAEADRAVEAVFAGSPATRYLLLASKSPENPVPAMLGAATHVLVTEDSVSMVSEASTAGFRVGLLRVGRKQTPKTKVRNLFGAGTVRFDALFEEMAARGFVEDLGPAPDFDAFLAPETRRIETPFNEAKRAAEWILSRWKPAEEKN